LLIRLMEKKKLKQIILDLAREGAIKQALLWLARKAAFLTTGPFSWLTEIIINQIWDAFGDKVVRWAFRKGVLVYDKTDGYIKAVKIKKSRGKRDSSYDSSVDDIFK